MKPVVLFPRKFSELHANFTRVQIPSLRLVKIGSPIGSETPRLNWTSEAQCQLVIPLVKPKDRNRPKGAEYGQRGIIPVLRIGVYLLLALMPYQLLREICHEIRSSDYGLYIGAQRN